MDILKLLLVLLIVMSLYLLMVHFWVGFIDCIKHWLKRLFHLEKKVKWHTLNDTAEINEESPSKQNKS